MIWLSLALAEDVLTRRALGRAAPIEAEARAAAEACAAPEVVCSQGPANGAERGRCEAEVACLDAVIVRYAPTTVRIAGKDVPVELPTVKMAREHTAAVRAALAAGPAEAAADWEATAANAARATPEALAAVDAYLARWADPGFESDVFIAAGVRHAELQSALEATPLTAPWVASVVKAGAPPAVKPPRLRLLMTRKHGFDEHDAWLARNGLDLGRTQDASPLLHDRGLDWVQDGRVAAYGARTPAPLVAVYGEAGIARVFDLSALTRAPSVVPGDEDYVQQELVYANVREGVLYVVTAHRTYAASSKGQNAYVTAFDADTGELRWRSRPLVANVQALAFVDGWILAGYGFTAEKDFLYVLSPADGAVVATVPVPSGPDWIVVKGRTAYVRTYDAELTFAIE